MAVYHEIFFVRFLKLLNKNKSLMYEKSEKLTFEILFWVKKWQSYFLKICVNCFLDRTKSCAIENSFNLIKVKLKKKTFLKYEKVNYYRLKFQLWPETTNSNKIRRARTTGGTTKRLAKERCLIC